jgi:hypothetical protein
MQPVFARPSKYPLNAHVYIPAVITSNSEAACPQNLNPIVPRKLMWNLKSHAYQRDITDWWRGVINYHHI